MRISRVPIMIIALSGIAILQVVGLTRERRVEPLLPGERISARRFDEQSRLIIAAERTPCLMIWVMDPDCAACRRLAEKEGKHVAAIPGFYWAFAGSDSAVDTFVKQYGLEGGQILRFVPKADVSGALRRLRVVATPTRIVATQADLLTKEVRVLNQELLDQPARLELASCR